MKDFARFLAGPLFALLFLVMPATSATLKGHTVTSKYFFPFITTPLGTVKTVVGAGAEMACPGRARLCGIGLVGAYTLDFGSDTISFEQKIDRSNAYAEGEFNGWVFSGLKFGAGIAGVSLTSHGIRGLDETRLSFTHDSVTLNLEGLKVAAKSSWRLQLDPVVVPVPASGALLLAGLAGMTLVRRRGLSTDSATPLAIPLMRP